MTAQYPVELQELKLYTLGGGSAKNGDKNKVVDLSGIARTVDIYEDILRPFIYGEIVVEDYIDLHNQIEITGNQYVKIVMKTPNPSSKSNRKKKSTPIEYKLWVKSIKNMVIGPTGKGKAYKICLISEESLKGISKIVNQQFNTEHSSAVQEIFDKHIASEKEIVLLEPTKGAQITQIENLNPFQAIDLIRRRSVSKDNIGSAYCFFERPEGFVFCSIEKMFEDAKNSNGEKTFTLQLAQRMNPDAHLKSIIGYQHVNTFDILEHLRSGGYNNEVSSFDLLTGEIRKVEFKIEDKIGSYKYPVSNPKGIPTKEAVDLFGQTPAKRFFHVFDSTRGEQQFAADMIGHRIGLVQQIIANLLWVHLPGDTEIHAGDSVTLKFPTMENTPDTLLSGNYLVSRVRHIIAIGSVITHTMSCECVRATFAEDDSA